MTSQNIFLFIYDVEYELLNIIKHIKQNDKELGLIEFIEEFTLAVQDYYEPEKYKKYLVLAAVKFYIDRKKTYKGMNIPVDQDEFVPTHLNQMYNIYNADYDDFDNYSLITDPDSNDKKYNTNINRNFFLQFNEYQPTNNSDELFDNIPHFTEMKSSQYEKLVN